MIAINEVNLYRGKPIQITDKIVLKSPTWNEVFDYGEKEYLNFIHTFTSTNMDANMIVFLTDIGLDFNSVNSWDLFVLLCKIMNKSSCLLFGDLDFSTLEPKSDNGVLYLQNKDGVIIDEAIHGIMVNYVRKMNNIAPPKYTRVKDDPVQKQMAIDDARNQIESQKRKERFAPTGSLLLPIISSMVNQAGFKHDERTVFDMNIYPFWDSVNRISAIDNARNLYRGLYNGCLDLKANPSLKKELDWMRRL